MPNEQPAENPQGTPPVEPTQTPTAPPDPIDGTPAPGQQEGTPGEAERAEQTKEYFQKKYQEMVESQKALEAELGTYQTTFGSLDQALAQANQPAGPEAQPPEEEQIQFDPYDAESMKNYFDHQMNQIRVETKNAARDAYQQVRAEEKYNLQAETATKSFNQWCIKNKIPQDLVNEALGQYQARWGHSGTPQALVEYMSGYIVNKSKELQAQQLTGQQVAASVDAAQQLAGVEIPAQGAPPSPTQSAQPTAMEQMVNDIVPDDPEPKFD
jgi:hypothetical protein